MREEIQWVLIMEIREGQAHLVRPLIDDMVAATHAGEPGALTYEYFLNADESRCTVLERYKDTDAAMVHLENFGRKFADRFLAIFAPVNFTVYGPAGEPLRKALSGFGATYEDRISGFAR